MYVSSQESYITTTKNKKKQIKTIQIDECLFNITYKSSTYYKLKKITHTHYIVKKHNILY